MMFNTPGDATVDCELAWSPDSVKWYRVNPGTPFIPRGPEGSYDAGCIYAPAGSAIARNGQLLIFYGGSTAKHIGTKRHCLPCLARLRLDGFAALRASEPGAKGFVVTQPMRCTGEPLRLSADAKGGAIRVAVLDQPGFELDALRPCQAGRHRRRSEVERRQPILCAERAEQFVCSLNWSLPGSTPSAGLNCCGEVNYDDSGNV